MEKVFGAAAGVAMICYLVLGLVQIFATVAGIAVTLDIPVVIAWILSSFIGYIPIVGTVMGIYGAIEGWGWALWQALALFLGPWIVILGFGLITVAFDRD